MDIDVKRNYFNYLLIMEKSKFTENALLILNIKYKTAFIKFKCNKFENKFNEYSLKLKKYNFINIFTIIDIASRLGMDIDGDAVPLDIFIIQRDLLFNKI